MELNKENILNLLNNSDKAVGRAVFAIYQRQTISEQNSKETTESNGVGFTGADANIGSSMAEFYIKRGYLTEKQIAYWRKPNSKGVPRIGKYWRQLIDIAKQKQEAAH